MWLLIHAGIKVEKTTKLHRIGPLWRPNICQISILTGHAKFNCQTISSWRHQMETFSALLAICAGNSPVSGEFPAQRPVTRAFDVSFDLRLNKRLSKQSWGWWLEMISCSLWRQSNVIALLWKFDSDIHFKKVTTHIMYTIVSKEGRFYETCCYDKRLQQ